MIKIDKESLKCIQNLVGEITEDNLKYVDFFVSKELSLFIPSVGFCEYAIKEQHRHPAYSFILFFSEKQSLVKVDIKITPDSYLVAAIGPNIAHEEEKKEEFTRYIAIFVAKEFYEHIYRMYEDEVPESYFWNQFLVNQDMMIYIKKFMTEYENKEKGYRDMLNSIAYIITHSLIRSLINVKKSGEVYSNKFEVEMVIEYMHQNFSEKIKVRELAKFIKMSESNFIRVFKAQTNLTPIDYLIKIRLDKGKKLLRSGMWSITETALKCGFNSTSHFSYCFTKAFDITPSEYKKLYFK